MTAASLHLVNIKSVKDLKERIANKYKEKVIDKNEAIALNDFDAELFRPNIVIDYD